MIILLNGAIASGKTTIGKALEQTLREEGHFASFYDIDDEVKKLNPQMEWDNEASRLHDWLLVRKNIALSANQDSAQKKVAIVAGPLFTREELRGLVDHLEKEILVYLFTLHAPIEHRLAREDVRKRNAPALLLSQEQLLSALLEKFGIIIENTQEPEVTVLTILKLMKDGEGILDRGLLA